MVELKTLKDLDYIESCTDWQGEKARKFIGKKELKAEAVKWIKYYREKDIGMGREIREDWIKIFFNIKEEDLK